MAGGRGVVCGVTIEGGDVVHGIVVEEGGVACVVTIKRCDTFMAGGSDVVCGVTVEGGGIICGIHSGGGRTINLREAGRGH